MNLQRPHHQRFHWNLTHPILVVGIITILLIIYADCLKLNNKYEDLLVDINANLIEHEDNIKDQPQNTIDIGQPFLDIKNISPGVDAILCIKINDEIAVPLLVNVDVKTFTHTYF